MDSRVFDSPETNEAPAATEDDIEAGQTWFDPSAPSAFKLLNLIGVGGFGEVWEATQLTLNRPIAIKKMRADLAEQAAGRPGAMRRHELCFRQEALITASLEHPNIVPVHDLGVDDDGHPLLIMKLVRGKPWDKIIHDDFAMPPGQFLAKHIPILVSVSQAVAFAHSRGVIHRDIKPSQIMVGEFGEVQLMDWGIAMRLDQVEHAIAVERGDKPPRPKGCLALATNPSGTVAFMAPEQTENLLVNLGPLTDVYLLGGSLYYLLTGRVPHGAANTTAAFFQAGLGEVAPPEERAPEREVPADLSALAMHAMEKKRENRVASAEDFIRRLKDYLSGDGKKKESIALAKTVAECLASMPESYRGLDDCHNNLDRAILLWPENPRIAPLRQTSLAAYAELALKHGDLTLARLQAERLDPGAKRLEILRQVKQLELETRQAAKRLTHALGDAKELINFMLFDLHSGLQRIGRLDLLEKVASKAIEHFESFPEESAATDMQLRRCKALRNVADVFKDQARVDRALQALQDAVAIARATLEQDPENSEWLMELSDAWDRMAAAYYEKGDLDAALSFNGKGMTIREQLLARMPNDFALRSRIAWSLHQEGVILWRKGRQDDAMGDMQRAIVLRRALLTENPANVEEATALAYTLNSKTWVLRAVGDLDGALADMQQCIALREDLAQSHPENINLQADIAWGLKSLGLLHEDRQEPKLALEAFNAGLAISKRLSDSDPSNVNRRMELAFSYGGVGRNLHAMGMLRDAETAYRDGTAIQSRIVEQDSTNSRNLRDYTYSLSGLSVVLFDQMRYRDALDVAEQAAEIARILMQRVTSNPVFAELKARTLVHMGRVKRGLKDERGAQVCWRSAIEMMQPFYGVGTHPPVQEETLAKAFLYLGRKEEAAPIVERLLGKNWKGKEFLELVKKEGMGNEE
ncbi:hypothetical protein BH09SUM1_BH09SUM1_23670 [soil metagenome]